MPYQSVLQSLHAMICRPGMEALIVNHWRLRRARRTAANLTSMGDVYDGKIWADYMCGYMKKADKVSYDAGHLSLNSRTDFEKTWIKTECDAEVQADLLLDASKRQFVRVPLLEENNMIALALHEDGVNPFKRNAYSVGLLYLIVLNLPRRLRYRPENMIKVAYIPPLLSEEKRNKVHATIHDALRPLVDELLLLFHPAGVEFKPTPLHGPAGTRYRAMLIAVLCDIPASRSVGGFGGVSAWFACNKCEMRFQYVPNASGKGKKCRYTHACGTIRTKEKVREQAANYYRALSSGKLDEADELRKNSGVSWSILLLLAYYDPVRMLVIDSMHMLFLGVAKAFLFHLTTSAKVGSSIVINQKQLGRIEAGMTCFIGPSDIGRIPRKIISCFDRMTADEFRLFTLYFSLPLFCNISLDVYLIEAWSFFVRACWIWCHRDIDPSQSATAAASMKRFCDMLASPLGAENLVSPNMIKFNHHLASSHNDTNVRDYGPPPATWNFALEQFNGLCMDTNMNGLSIECSIMQTMLRRDRLLDIVLHNLDFKQRASSACSQALSLKPSEQQSILDAAQRSPTLEHWQLLLSEFNYVDGREDVFGSKDPHLLRHDDCMYSKAIQKLTMEPNLSSSIVRDEISRSLGVRQNRSLLFPSSQCSLFGSPNRHSFSGSSRAHRAFSNLGLKEALKQWCAIRERSLEKKVSVFHQSFVSYTRLRLYDDEIASGPARNSYVCALMDNNVKVQIGVGHIEFFFTYGVQFENEEDPVLMHFAFIRWYQEEAKVSDETMPQRRSLLSRRTGAPVHLIHQPIMLRMRTLRDYVRHPPTQLFRHIVPLDCILHRAFLFFEPQVALEKAVVLAVPILRNISV